MKSKRLKIFSLVLAGLIMQGTCVSFAESGSNGYTKEELDNIQPGWSWKDKDKSDYRVNSFKNTFSSKQSPTKEDDNDISDGQTTASFDQIGPITQNAVENTWGNRGLYWARMADKTWMLLENGVPQTGWKLVNGKWYYMNSNGIMQTGWINDVGTWYYLYENGEMAANTYVDRYYLGSNGAMVW
ncbi:MAG: cell wall-binding protein [Clostridium butyricum]|nr:cell wall-binding protein [Clostridium butyricum]